MGMLPDPSVPPFPMLEPARHRGAPPSNGRADVGASRQGDGNGGEPTRMYALRLPESVATRRGIAEEPEDFTAVEQSPSGREEHGELSRRRSLDRATSDDLPRRSLEHSRGLRRRVQDERQTSRESLSAHVSQRETALEPQSDADSRMAAGVAAREREREQAHAGNDVRVLQEDGQTARNSPNRVTSPAAGTNEPAPALRRSPSPKSPRQFTAFHEVTMPDGEAFTIPVRPEGRPSPMA
jgi:hypothetical protein